MIFIIIFIFGLVINLPFLSQAFHIDDPLNIYMARHILVNLGNPYDFSLIYNGAVRKFYQFYANPPANGYFLSSVIRIFGENEIYLHLVYTLFTMLSGLFMFLISKKFLVDRKDSLLSTILFLISPAIFVMEHTVMPDMPLLSFYLAAVYFFLEGVDRNAFLFYVISGVFAALSCLTRYSGFTLMPLFIIYPFIKNKKVNFKFILSIFIPLAAFYFWYKRSLSLYSSDYWSNISSFEMFSKGKLEMVITHLIANLTYLGGSVIFPLSLPLVINKSGKKSAFVNIGSSVLIASVFTISAVKNFDYSLTQSVLLFIFSFCFISFLFVLFSHFKGWLILRQKNLFLVFWIVILIVFNSLFMHTAVKYNMLIVPPVILLFIILLRISVRVKYRSLLVPTIIATFILGLFVAIGDMKLANTYRDTAKGIFSVYKDENNKIYYTGHWGWEYYMSKLGAKPVISGGQNYVSSGDILVVPSIPWPQPLPLYIENRISLIEKIVIDSEFPVRTMNGWAKAFFYANYNFPRYIGFTPYSFSTKIPLEVFYVFKIE